MHLLNRRWCPLTVRERAEQLPSEASCGNGCARLLNHMRRLEFLSRLEGIRIVRCRCCGQGLSSRLVRTGAWIDPAKQLTKALLEAGAQGRAVHADGFYVLAPNAASSQPDTAP